MSELPNTMQAALLTHDGFAQEATGLAIDDAADWLEDAEIPVPQPDAGQVLIRMRASSVNPSDLHFIKGEYGQPRIKGSPAGFEGCGDVVATGAGAEHLAGQRVAFVAAGSGAWAEYALTPAMMCIPLRPDISDFDGAAQIVNPLTAMAMVDIAKQAGDAFIISAATSQLGKLMCALGRDLGLSPIALVRRADAVEFLKEIGAAEVLVTGEADFADRLTDVIKTLKPRVFLDAVADQQCETVFTAMPNGARWIIYGKLSTEPPALTQTGQFIFMSKQIEGFWLSKWMSSTPPEDQMRVVGEVQARFADGRWSTDVAATIPLRDLVGTLAETLKTTKGKIMIVSE
ncbi:alcohol dehydrogenase catalytic domain-containing protein [Ruegeria jejuensis]|uniref:alcohol dehydrogenase catalytic domain-containing protein n=1 Tax=Ruegeria jejuensis TaxID=3233338 RepID=UPI00355B9AAD